METTDWIPASEPPSTPRVVIATDLEGQFMAVFENGEWWNAATDEPIDSFVTHWTEQLPLPEEEIS